jgi:hypothetical protein
MKKITLLYIALFVSFFYSELYCQINKYHITGSVSDSVTGQALPNVNIIAGDKKGRLINGAVTDKYGNFRIDNINVDTVEVKILHLGYKSKIFDTVLTKKSTDIGKIVLLKTNYKMPEIVITSEKPLFEYFIDKQVINISAMPGKDGSILEVLSASGTVDVDLSKRTISNRGNKVQILIDNKPSLISTEILADMRANNFDKIEIKTMPAAKDNPELAQTVINLVSPKKQFDNLSLTTTAGGGTNERGNASLGLNYREGKLSVLGNLGVYASKDENNTHMDELNFYSENNNRETANTNSKLTYKNLYSLAGVEYRFDELNTINLSYNYTKAKYSENILENADIYNSLQQLNYNTKNKSATDNTNNEHKGSLYYQKKFNKTGNELTMDSYFLSYKRSEDGRINNKLSYDELPALTVNTNNISNKTFVFKTDYVYPFGTQKIEAGYLFTFRDRKNDYLSLQSGSSYQSIYDSMNGSNSFRYKENIHSAYLMYTDQINRIGFSLGLRLEDAFTNGTLINTDLNFNKTYFSLYPSLRLFYSLSNIYNIYFNFGRKITRPNMDFINPFTKLITHNQYYKGNAQLKPVYTTMYELQFPPYISLYYTNSKDNYRYINVLSRDSINVYSYANLSSVQTYGADLTLLYYKQNSFSIKLPQFIDLVNLKFTFYRTIQKGNYESENLDTKKNIWRLKFNTTLKIFYDLSLQLAYSYYPKQRDARSYSNAYSIVNASLYRNFFDRKLRMGLSFDNILNKHAYYSEAYASNYYYSSTYDKLKSRSVSLTVTYVFNNFKMAQDRNTDDGRDSFSK